jgi:hypothetical protein
MQDKKIIRSVMWVLLALTPLPITLFISQRIYASGSGNPTAGGAIFIIDGILSFSGAYGFAACFSNNRLTRIASGLLLGGFFFFLNLCVGLFLGCTSSGRNFP